MKHLLVVLTEPVEGREAEYDEYYESLHIDEVLDTTGWQSGQRYHLTDEAGAKCPLPFLAIYEAEAEAPADVLQTLADTRSQRIQSDALNMKTAAAWVFSPSGPRHERKPPD